MEEYEELNKRLEENNIQRVYTMGELDTVLGGLSPTEVLYRVGEKKFTTKDDYFIVNGVGSLESFEDIDTVRAMYEDVGK